MRCNHRYACFALRHGWRFVSADLFRRELVAAVSETGDDVDAEMTDEQKARVASYLRIKDSPRKETDG